VVLSIFVLLGVAGRLYLGSRHFSGLIVSRLEAAYGGPVQVGETDVGFDGTSLHDLQLYETGADDSALPWLTVNDVQADLNLWKLLGGQTTPEELTLDGAAIMLTFDQSNHFVTQLPSAREKAQVWPKMRLENACLTLRQHYRSDFVLTGLEGDLQQDGNRVIFTGAINDPTWGQWSLEGSLDLQTGATAATLRSKGLHVTQTMLDQLPFVPASTWKHVQCDGATPVEMTLNYDPLSHRSHYRVVLHPENTQVSVSSIDLDADQASGKVVIEDKIVRLSEVKGKTALGEIWTDADLNYQNEIARLNFDIRVQRLLLSKLPKSWKLPSQVDGRLSGTAKLVVAVVDGKSQPNGDGQGVVSEGRLGGLPVVRPIHIRMYADGKKFHFSQGQSKPQPNSMAPGS
jgi:hypothetical protein